MSAGPGLRTPVDGVDGNVSADPKFRTQGGKAFVPSARAVCRGGIDAAGKPTYMGYAAPVRTGAMLFVR